MTENENTRFKFLAFDELMATFEEHEQELNRKVKIEDGYIGFPEYDYWVHLSRIRTHAEIVSWVMHLTEKDWVTNEMLHVFVRKAGSRNKLNVRVNC